LLHGEGRDGGVCTNESPPTIGLDPVWAPDKSNEAKKTTIGPSSHSQLSKTKIFHSKFPFPSRWTDIEPQADSIQFMIFLILGARIQKQAN
jgi:hypothetical protein